MSVTTAIRVGTFCWPELCTADASIAKTFYGSLFGWEPDDVHMPEGDYTAFKLGGQGVAGMYQMTEDRKTAGVLPHWNSYVAVSDADETASKTAALGGKVLTQPFDADVDRMANLQDPTGAKFSIWQGRKTPEAIRINEVGALCWTELYTHDADAAKAFYTGLFGWRAEPFTGGEIPYTLFAVPGMDMPMCGMCQMTDEMPGDPHWLPYFQVEDADKTAARVRELGGHIINEPMDIPEAGRMATFTDPLGAEFAVITLGCAEAERK